MPTNPDEFSSRADSRLAADGFNVRRDIALPDGAKMEVVASRNKFTWKGLSILSQHVLVYRAPSISVQGFGMFCNGGFAYAKSINRLPLFRGLQFGYMIIACAVVEAASPQLIVYVEGAPRIDFALFEFPVLHDCSTGQTHFFRKTELWGAFYFSDARAIINTAFGS